MIPLASAILPSLGGLYRHLLYLVILCRKGAFQKLGALTSAHDLKCPPWLALMRHQLHRPFIILKRRGLPLPGYIEDCRFRHRRLHLPILGPLTFVL